MDEDLELEPQSKPEVVLHHTWVFKLSKRDALLVLKALGGRLTDKDAPEAKALGDRLTVLRANVGQDYQNSLDRAAKAAAEGWTEPKK